MNLQERKTLRKVAKDIFAIKFKDTDTIKSIRKSFYAVMRKHGIKQGEWSKGGNGRLVNNYEWTLYHGLFYDNLNAHFRVWECLSSPPKDLLAYGKQPKQNKP